MIVLSNFEKLLCRPLILFTASFIAGVMCRGPSRNLETKPAAVIALIVIFTGSCILIAGEGWMRKPFRTGALYYCVIWMMCPLFCFAGYFRTIERGIESPLKSGLNKSSDATVRGTVSDISLRSDGFMLTLTDCAATVSQQEFQAKKINIIISEGAATDYRIGDGITASGKLYPFESATNYGQFDSELYYRIRGIDARMYAGEIMLTDATVSGTLVERIGYRIGNILFRLRMHLTDGINAVLPQKEAGSLIAMLTGERGLLDSELKQLYSDGGIAHILSISALHVTLLGMGFFRLLMLVTGRLRLSGCITIILVILYGAMTGFSVSTQRAVIMLTVSLAARMSGRAYDRLSAGGLAALVILSIQPLCIYDAGFKMSFTAVLGINTIQWIIEIYEIEKPVVKAVLTCLAVQVFMLPVILSTYYEISVYAIFINPIILIFMAVLLVSGAIAGIISQTFRIVAGLFAGPVYFILKMYEGLCELELKLPYSKIVTGAPDRVRIIIYYAVLIFIMTVVVRKKQTFALIGLLVCGFIFIGSREPFEAYFVDVGQGDSELVRCENMNILIDGGSSNVSDVGTYRLIPFLKYLGIRRLDTVIVSHTDSDHVNGILKLLEEGYPKIGSIIVGYNIDDSDKLAVAALQAGVPLYRAAAGDVIVGKGMESFTITALAPEEKVHYKDANAASLTVLAKYGGFSLLLTGDSGTDSEKRYMKKLEEPVSVLKVAHHGSKYSTSSELLMRALPAAAFISCSKYNSYGHPAPETLARLTEAGTEIFATPQSGMIILIYRGGEYFDVTTFTGR